MSEYYDQFFCPFNQSYSVIIEDDGRVGYAYLLFEKNIVGDVWLYNQLSAPRYVDWGDKGNMPFLNPLEFVKEEISPITDFDVVDIGWESSDDSALDNAQIYINGKLVAKLADGSYPGWSSAVVKDGPLANVL